jgi:H+-transporting ATPase
VQVVFFLACLAMFHNLNFTALYIILLALFHDLQIVTIAYDYQVESPFPETPTVTGLLMQSWTMGIVMFVQTIGLIEFGNQFMTFGSSSQFQESYDKTFGLNGYTKNPDGMMDKYLETCVFLQISNSSAILILSARTVSWFFTTMPCPQLLFTTILGQVIINTWICFFAGALVARLDWQDIVCIWIYDILGLVVLDVIKMCIEALWDKIKPADLEENPAMQKEAKDRLKRRASGSLQAPQAAPALTAKKEEAAGVTKRLSKRISERRG